MNYALFVNYTYSGRGVGFNGCSFRSSIFKGKKVHIIAGRTYFWGMTIIFLTAIPMSIVSGNVFLFLIAIFSFYLAYAGMRFARNRTGIANIFDWVAVGLMILSGMVMWCLAIFYFINNNSQYITLIIF